MQAGAAEGEVQQMNLKLIHSLTTEQTAVSVLPRVLSLVDVCVQSARLKARIDQLEAAALNCPTDAGTSGQNGDRCECTVLHGLTGMLQGITREAVGNCDQSEPTIHGGERGN